VSLIQVSTGNVWHRRQAIDSAVRYPGVELDGALEIAEKFEVWNTWAELSCSVHIEKVSRRRRPAPESEPA